MCWAIGFLPDGNFIVTERPGTIRVVCAKGQIGTAIAGVPPVDYGGQGGLLVLSVDGNFAQSRAVYFCFGDKRVRGSSTALASANLAGDSKSRENVRVIFRRAPKVQSRHYFGCRIVEGPDGNLFTSIGDRFDLLPNLSATS